VEKVLHGVCENFFHTKWKKRWEKPHIREKEFSQTPEFFLSISFSGFLEVSMKSYEPVLGCLLINRE